jgi:hypothetical protein
VTRRRAGGSRGDPGGTTLEAGEIVGAYVVERVVAAGGMGTIYRAIERASRRAVALNVMSGDAETDRARFACEITAPR